MHITYYVTQNENSQIVKPDYSSNFNHLQNYFSRWNRLDNASLRKGRVRLQVRRVLLPEVRLHLCLRGYRCRVGVGRLHNRLRAGGKVQL